MRELDILVAKARLKKEIRKCVEWLGTALMTHDFGMCSEMFQRARLMSEAHYELEFALGGDDRDEKSMYVLSSMFLNDLAERLAFSGKDEDMVLATGKDFGPVKMVDQVVTVDIKTRSSVYVRADDKSLAKALYKVDCHGQKLLAWMHSHPGKGKDATHPSGKDMDTQERLERAGYPVIGLIFSRDGWMRPFSCTGKFRVWIYGDLVEESSNEAVYRLLKAGNGGGKGCVRHA